jgi:hypothetical protein
MICRRMSSKTRDSSIPTGFITRAPRTKLAHLHHGSDSIIAQIHPQARALVFQANNLLGKAAHTTGCIGTVVVCGCGTSSFSLRFGHPSHLYHKSHTCAVCVQTCSAFIGECHWRVLTCACCETIFVFTLLHVYFVKLSLTFPKAGQVHTTTLSVPSFVKLRVQPYHHHLHLLQNGPRTTFRCSSPWHARCTAHS